MAVKITKVLPPINVREIKRLRQVDFQRKEPIHLPFQGTITEEQGSVHPDNRINYVWVREYNQQESKHVVFNNRVTPIAGLHVWVGKDPKPPHQLKILEEYTDGLFEGETGNAGSFNIPPHAPTHQMPSEDNLGADPVKIYQPAIQPLKTTSNGSLTIVTQSFIYHYNGVRKVFPGAVTDLSAYVPGAGLVRRVLVWLNPITNSLQITEGTPVLDNNIIPIPYPEIPTPSQPSAYVKLSNGQLVIITALHIEDTRKTQEGRGMDEGYLATKIGQLLFSVDGVSFTAERPVTNESGLIVTNESGIIVVE